MGKKTALGNFTLHSDFILHILHLRHIIVKKTRKDTDFIKMTSVIILEACQTSSSVRL